MKTSVLPERDGYHHGDLRNALLEAAARLVGQKGPEAFSLREAAREVGVSPAAAYRHFADKNALVAALSEEAHSRLAAAMERAVARAAGKPGSRSRAVNTFLAIGETYVDFAVRNPSRFRVMFGPCFEMEGFAPGSAPSGRDAFQILVDTLDELVATGAVLPEARAGAELAAWSSVHGLASLIVAGALPMPAKAQKVAVLGLARGLLAGLGVEPALLPDVPRIPIDPRVLRGEDLAKPAQKRAAP